MQLFILQQKTLVGRPGTSRRAESLVNTRGEHYFPLFSHLFLCYLLGKGGYVCGSVGLFVCLSVCLSVCLFVCGQHYSKSYERIGMKFYGGVLGSTIND